MTKRLSNYCSRAIVFLYITKHMEQYIKDRIAYYETLYTAPTWDIIDDFKTMLVMLKKTLEVNQEDVKPKAKK